jgi:hypothetical protein
MSLVCSSSVPAFRLRRTHSLRALRARLCLVLGLGAAALAALPAGHAAAAAGCRSDPVIVVNGAVADVVSTLYTDPSVVRELDYTVTVPAGSLIGRTTLTLGLGFPEKVTYVYSAAQPWGSLRVDATVQTQAGTAPFATDVQVTTLLGGVRRASGLSTATVSVTVAHQLML